MMLDFFHAAANLKKIPRQGWVDKLSVQNPESVADHTFSMAIMGMLLSDMENLDTGRILKMILLHDLAESKIGDFTPEQIDRKKKHILEDRAFSEILSLVPKGIREEYEKIWDEFTSNESEEARMVHQIDRLEMSLQAKIYQKDCALPYDKLETFFESARKEITDKKLKELFIQITKE